MSTVIADRKSRRMVADRKMTLHSTSVAKVFKVQGFDGAPWLLGGAGVMSSLLAFVEWFKDPSTETAAPPMEGLHVMAMNYKGQLYLYYGTTQPIHLQDKFFSIGSGGDYAMGALEAGATPEQALRIASKRDSGTGNGKIQVAL